MSNPALQDALSPSPNDRNIRAATASIATAAAIVLSVIASALIPGSPAFAILTAAGAALGAASVIAALRRRGRIRFYPWLSALGGAIILIIGILTAISRIGASAMLSTATLSASYVLMPFAISACFIGGLGQLPVRWIAPTLLSIFGAASAGWFSIGSNSGVEHVLIVISAILALVGCAMIVKGFVEKRFLSLESCLLALTTITIAALMLHMIGLVLIPAWPWLPPAVVAWSYLISALLGTFAGLLSSSKS